MREALPMTSDSPTADCNEDRLTKAQALILDALRRLLRASIDHIDAEVLATLERVGRFAQADRSYVFRLRDDALLDNSHEWVAAGIEPMQASLQGLPLEMIAQWQTSFERDQPVYIADVNGLPEHAPEKTTLQRQGIRSLLVAPMLKAGRFYGMIGFDLVRKHGDFLPGEVFLLKSVADVIGSVLQHSDTVQEMRQIQAQLQDTGNRLRTTLAAMPDLVIEIDGEGRYVSFNTDENRFPFVDVPALRGKLMEEVLPPQVARSRRLLMHQLDQGTPAVRQNYKLPTPSGPRWMELSGALLPTPAGSERRYLFVARDITARVRDQNELAYRDDLLTALFDVMPAGMLLVDPRNGCILEVNRAMLELTGQSREALLNLRSMDVVPGLDVAGEGIRRDLERRTRFGPLQLFCHRADGTSRPVQILGFEVMDSAREPRIWMIVENLSETRRLQAALLAQRDFLATLMNTSMTGIAALDDKGRVLFANREAAAILDLDQERLVDQATGDPLWLAPQNDEAVTSVALRSLVAEVIGTGREIRNLRILGGTAAAPRHVSVDAVPLAAPVRGARVVITARDITGQTEAEQALREAARRQEFLATHDPLTGLANRALLKHCIVQALSEPDAVVALLFLDLDNFKTINDSLGHRAGDMLLRLVANRLRALLAPGQTLARLGGDEFVVLLPRAGLTEATSLAEAVLETLGAPFDLDEQPVFLSTSIGLAIAPDHGADEGELIRNADIAMYRAKELGRNRFATFHPEFQDKSSHQSAVIQALRHSLRNGGFRLKLQPKFDIRSGQSGPRMIGAEALLRWNAPGLGETPPDVFIPIAESTGLVRELDAHVTKMLVGLLAGWNSDGGPCPTVAVNISAQSFQDTRFAERLLELLAQNAVPPTALSIEITETTLMKRSSSASDNIRSLRAAGITIAIDDFGTGYSSLSYLQRLPLAELKIDRSFIARIGGRDRDGEVIVTAILLMAQALGLRTVAEGVETDAQFEWLRSEGCDMVQGYFLSPPLEPQEFIRLYREGRARPDPAAPTAEPGA
ncbi:EAL domain-containing protein [Plastorhodobacter daqingensis]|uniref:EAL domain-containing protein n=1 Tax=Plastorhodobacter daqingensis TaxID=1387281 RepID=A0ABW2ULW9_9RHOB